MNVLVISSVFWLSTLGFFGPVGTVSAPMESTTQVGTLGLDLEESRTGVGTLGLELEDSRRDRSDRSDRGVGTLSLELEDSAPGIGSLYLDLEDSPRYMRSQRSKARRHKARVRHRDREPTGSLHLPLE